MVPRAAAAADIFTARLNGAIRGRNCFYVKELRAKEDRFSYCFFESIINCAKQLSIVCQLVYSIAVAVVYLFFFWCGFTSANCCLVYGTELAIKNNSKWHHFD